MNVDVRLSTSRALFLFAVTLLLAAAGPASAEEICFQASDAGSGPGLFFHLNPSTSSTFLGQVITLVGLVRSNVAGAITLDPVTGTGVTEGGPPDVEALRVNLIRTAVAGTTIYNARLTKFANDLPPYQYYWLGFATVNRLPQGTTLFPQTTEQIVLIDCVTRAIRWFF